MARSCCTKQILSTSRISDDSLDMAWLEDYITQLNKSPWTIRWVYEDLPAYILPTEWYIFRTVQYGKGVPCIGCLQQAEVPISRARVVAVALLLADLLLYQQVLPGPMAHSREWSRSHNSRNFIFNNRGCAHHRPPHALYSSDPSRVSNRKSLDSKLFQYETCATSRIEYVKLEGTCTMNTRRRAIPSQLFFCMKTLCLNISI